MTTERFVIESPFQLLMANEARHQLDLHDSAELLVLWPSGATSRQTIKDVLNRDPWERLIDGGIRSSRTMVQRSRLIRHLGQNPRDRLFIGDYFSPFMRHLAVCQPSGSAYLIDDGRGTVNTWRIRTSSQTHEPRPDTRTWRRKAALRALRLRVDGPVVLRYFTFFDLRSTDTELVESNDLGLLRSRLPDVEATGPMLFLGSAFAERTMMATDHYVALLRLVSGANPGMQYRPHRDESADKLAVLRDELGIEVIAGDGTIELALTTATVLPSSIMSFFSSATVTLHKLLGHKVRVGSFALNPADFVAGWFVAGDGLPALLTHTSGQIAVEPIPGRDGEDLAAYRHLIGEQ